LDWRFLARHRRFRSDQTFDCIPQVIFAEVRIAQGRFNSLVAHQNLDGAQRHAGHHEATGKGVPEVMPVKIGNFRLLGNSNHCLEYLFRELSKPGHT
jgi:hypothetical protein